MRIGFDVSQTGQAKAGCGYFADSIIRAMAAQNTNHEWLLYSNFGEDFWDPDHARTTTRISGIERRFTDFSHADAQDFWGRPRSDFEERLGWPDIIHANNFYCPGPVGKIKLVYTLYDLAVFSHPDLTTEANRLVCANGIFRASLYADFIVAISNSTRSHFLNTFPHYPDDRVAVVYPASRFALEDGTGRALKGLSPGTFWLAVGTLEPRKNWRGLLKAYAGLRKRGRTERLLVMAGSPGWMEEDLPQYIKYLGIEEFVIRTGYIPDAQLRWLYAHCFAFVYPSLFEGFGMPVLEAMSMGAAVITSNASSLPEVAGDAGIMVDPHDPGGLAEAMLRLENDPKLLAGCRSAGLTRSENFSWDRSASLVLAHYEALAG